MLTLFNWKTKTFVYFIILSWQFVLYFSYYLCLLFGWCKCVEKLNCLFMLEQHIKQEKKMLPSWKWKETVVWTFLLLWHKEFYGFCVLLSIWLFSRLSGGLICLIQIFSWLGPLFFYLLILLELASIRGFIGIGLLSFRNDCWQLNFLCERRQKKIWI